MIAALALIFWVLIATGGIVWRLGEIAGYRTGEVEGYNEGWDNCRSFYGMDDALEGELQDIIREEGESV